MGSFLDLTGQVFGDLRIARRLPSKGRRTIWSAICSCGCECSVYAENLRSKDERRLKTKCNKCSRMRPFSDLTGMKFGNFLVVRQAEPQYEKQMWQVRCSCGRECLVSKYRLLDGSSWKCKHCPTIDLSGRKFGQWTVVKRDANNSLRWLARCSCGTEFNILKSTLISGSSTRCRKCYSNADGKIPFSSWATLTRGAKIRGFSWSKEITREWLWDLFKRQEEKCALTGMPLCFSKRPRETTASLDRKDSQMGYEVGNVHFVHKHINIMKRDFSEEYFIEMCRKVAQKAIRTSGAAE